MPDGLFCSHPSILTPRMTNTVFIWLFLFVSKIQSEVISSLFSPLQEMYLIQTKEIKSSDSVLELKLLCTYVQERLLPP